MAYYCPVCNKSFSRKFNMQRHYDNSCSKKNIGSTPHVYNNAVVPLNTAQHNDADMMSDKESDQGTSASGSNDDVSPDSDSTDISDIDSDVETNDEETNSDTECDNGETNSHSDSDSEESTDTESDDDDDDEYLDIWAYMIENVMDHENQLEALKHELWELATLTNELRLDPIFRKIRKVQKKLMDKDYDYDESLRVAIHKRQFLLFRQLKRYLPDNVSE